MNLFLSDDVCFYPKGNFKIRDEFLKIIGYSDAPPVSAVRFLYGVLEELSSGKTFRLGGVLYDAKDIVEFVLSEKEFSSLTLPGFAYGKRTQIIRDIVRKPIWHTFSYLQEGEVLIETGYSETCISTKDTINVIPFGEKDFIQMLAHYILSMFLIKSGQKNADLRKKGIRGEILENFRRSAARVLFSRTKEVKFGQKSWKIDENDLKITLKWIVGDTALTKKIYSFSSFIGNVLRNLKPKRILFFSRLSSFKDTLSEIAGLPVVDADMPQILKRTPSKKRARVKRFEIKKAGSSLSEPLQTDFSAEDSMKLSLRFRKLGFSGKKPSPSEVLSHIKLVPLMSEPHLALSLMLFWLRESKMNRKDRAVLADFLERIIPKLAPSKTLLIDVLSFYAVLNDYSLRELKLISKILMSLKKVKLTEGEKKLVSLFA